MWIQIQDNSGEYLINLNACKTIKESFDCHGNFLIMFFCKDGDDLILSYEKEQERDDNYKGIIKFIENYQGRNVW